MLGIRIIVLIIAIIAMVVYGTISIAKHLTNKRRTIKYAEGTASVDFFNDLESPDIDRRRVGSHFWIACRRMRLTLYKNNWGSEIDYKFREDGFIETIHSIPEDEMPKLMKLCNNAKSEKAIVRYLYDRFSFFLVTKLVISELYNVMQNVAESRDKLQRLINSPLYRVMI